MRNILLNTYLVFGCALLWAPVSLVASICIADFTWFGRSGLVMTILGLLLTTKHTIFSDSRDIHKVLVERQNYGVYSPPKDSEQYTENLAKARNYVKDEYIGIAMTILGTAK